MKVDLGDLNAFVVVARAKGFRDGARATGVSASALSEAVRRLEVQVGVRLFNRTTRSVVPTEAGKGLLERPRPALTEMEAALDVANGFRDKPAGLLRLNVRSAQGPFEGSVKRGTQNIEMKIACLHTAQSNVAVFEEAAKELGLPDGSLHHEVRPDLLLTAEDAGGLTPDLERETASILELLGQEADAVILTCSTLGPSVYSLEKSTTVPIIRVDAALAEQALDAGGTTIALGAVATTIKPTTELFAEAAKRSGAAFEVRLVPGAWALFKAGNLDEYLSAIARAADAAYNDGATAVALAQASMAGAVDLVKCERKPLSSPIAGLRAVLDQISEQHQGARRP